MSTREDVLIDEMQRVERDCDFVRRVTLENPEADIVCVELIDELTQHLPLSLHTLCIKRAAFSLERVEQLVQTDVMEWLIEATDKARYWPDDSPSQASSPN